MGTVALNLPGLGLGMPGLTPARALAYAEAAAVCLERSHHVSGVQCELRGDQPSAGIIHWDEVDEQQRRTNADHQDATEEGAVALAILAVRELTGLVVVDRAVKGTGVDYWLGTPNNDPEDDDVLPFIAEARLEVSGIFAGTNEQLTARINNKLAQTAPTDHVNAAYVAVIEFSGPVIHVEEK